MQGPRIRFGKKPLFVGIATAVGIGVFLRRGRLSLPGPFAVFSRPNAFINWLWTSNHSLAEEFRQTYGERLALNSSLTDHIRVLGNNEFAKLTIAWQESMRKEKESARATS